MLFNKRGLAQLTGERSLRFSFRETFSWPRRVLAPFHVNWCLLKLRAGPFEPPSDGLRQR